ncbi:Na+:solute symporter [Amycolatopsis sp. QT-25]|nr:Na+:solute symporter [Amycolatopsis sp. QT-25]WET77092.1 Na+:solute symporter [Amycolatopsis sp. QT-25]
MHLLDRVMVSAYFVLMGVIGLWSHSRADTVSDFFTAGGKMPWWLAGISHHMSGYSAVLFVAYAGVAYTDGITVYFWGMAGIGIGVGIRSRLFAARWNRLRSKLGVASPLEYLAKRFDVPTQQALAWSGSLLKIFDIAAKWFAVATILDVFAGVPYPWGIVITGSITLIYRTVGGLWADALTDFGQFVVQAIAAIVMLWVVLDKLGGVSGLWTMWGDLPPAHLNPTTSKFTTVVLLVYVLVKTLEYNGGMWNLAQRYMAAPNTCEARRGARLSSILYLVWPLLLGMLPAFRRSGSRAALISWAGGLLAYAIAYYGYHATLAVTVSTPILVSVALFAGLGYLMPEREAATDEIIDTIDRDDDVLPPSPRTAPPCLPDRARTRNLTKNERENQWHSPRSNSTAYWRSP